MRKALLVVVGSALVVAGVVATSFQTVSAQAERKDTLILRGDLSVFYGPGKPGNCNLRSVYKHGEPVGWRIEAVDPLTGKHVEPEAELIVHLSYAGKSQDIKMR